MLYLLYRVGIFLAMRLPLKASYTIACLLADVYSAFSPRDRAAVTSNLKVIVGDGADIKILKRMSREVFRNFAKYLVDFFRFSLVNDDYIARHIKIDGLENIDKALSRGKGVIALSAHIGNWELGALILSAFRHPICAVVLTHKDKRINDFFTRQRSLKDLEPVEIGAGLRRCYEVLKNNGLVAMLGDRDFSKNGIPAEFFANSTIIPKGPAVFSYRIGSSIVPCFMMREKDDTFRFAFEDPITPPPAGSSGEEAAVRDITQKYSSVIERYVRRYPTQWYMFREVWNNVRKDMRPDTVV